MGITIGSGVTIAGGGLTFTSGPQPGFNTLWAWGLNDNGQLGTNDRVARSSPVQIGSATNWTTLATGGQSTPSPLQSTFGIRQNGALWAWGSNNVGVLGLNDAVNRSSPVQVGALTNWSKISVGWVMAALAVKTDGTLWSWGNNGVGTLGLNAAPDKSSPTQVGALTDWTNVWAGNAVVARRSNGTLWTWGVGTNGATGQGNTTTLSSPTQLGALTSWATAAAGKNTAFGIRTDGTLWAWGENTFGQLGLNQTASKTSPNQVGTGTNWSSITVSTSGDSVWAFKTDGTLWGWGYNGNGMLGFSDTTLYRSSPVQIGLANDWATLPAGDAANFFASAVKTGGTLYSWGRSTGGVRGNNTGTGLASSPVQVGASSIWVSTVAGNQGTLAMQAT